MKRGTLERKRPMKRTQPKRDWSAARAKVEHAACRLCAPDENCGPVEAAHVIGRECDRYAPCRKCKGTGEEKYGFADGDGVDNIEAPCIRCLGTGADPRDRLVHPDSVIPLGRDHHKLYDAHEVDVLQVLTLEEQVRAVEDAGGIEPARQRTAPSQYRTDAA